MPNRDVVVIGASAGGVEALQRLVEALPADLPAAVFVVLHVPSHGMSVLPRILDRRGPLPATHARDGEPIAPGRIYVAPPDSHLLIHDGTVRLSRGPRENGHRPAIDPTFRTAARAFGPRVIGVVLSGTLDDGTAGLAAIKRRGGLALVQDPDDALYGGMVRSALDHVEVDHVATAPGLASLIDRLAREPADEADDPPGDEVMEEEIEMEAMEPGAFADSQRPGVPSGFACPDCGGALWELDEGELVRFRCRVGHAWTAHGLLAEQSDALETALWTALRALEERAALAERVAARMRQRGSGRAAATFDAQVAESRRLAEVIRTQIARDHAPRDEIEPEGADTPGHA